MHFDFPGKLAMVGFLLLTNYSASAETITGRIVAIADGDTVTLLDASKQQHKIRLSGIDAPERKQASAMSRASTWLGSYSEMM